ncbi:MAG: hypothetical protein QXH71_02520 [Candidatus Anstonellaceae archaeon]
MFFSFGCLDKVVKFSCGFAGEESDHCLQFGAVQTSNPELCEEVVGKKFSSYGSNPPKDKCYLLIANKTNDPKLCDKIEGGLYSYTKEECLANIAKNLGDPKICNQITTEEEKRACLNAAMLNPKYILKTEQEQKEQQPTQQDKQDLKQTNNEIQLNKTLKEEKIREDDKTTLADLKLKPAAENKISSRTKEILEKMPQDSKEQLKQAAEQKEQLIAQTEKILPPPQNPISKDQQESYLSKAWSWVGWGGEKATDVYEGVGEKAPTSINVISTASKGTEAIKDLSELGESYNRVNEQIEKGKITSSQGQLLKTGYALGKGIKWVAKNVPIVGDTVGEVADKSFEAGMKFGEKLAEHTTKTNKCIEDPLSDDCD